LEIGMFVETLQPLPAALSVDTFYSKVARSAVEAGAHIVNDISGGRADPEMMATVRKGLIQLM
jgi:dihydropteroate synthase